MNDLQQQLVECINSPLNVEILYDVITSLRLKAGLSDYEVRQIIIENYNDWDK